MGVTLQDGESGRVVKTKQHGNLAIDVKGLTINKGLYRLIIA